MVREQGEGLLGKEWDGMGSAGKDREGVARTMLGAGQTERMTLVRERKKRTDRTHKRSLRYM